MAAFDDMFAASATLWNALPEDVQNKTTADRNKSGYNHALYGSYFIKVCGDDGLMTEAQYWGFI